VHVRAQLGVVPAGFGDRERDRLGDELGVHF